MQNIMSSSTMIWFEPTDSFWKFLSQHPWRWKQYHDCGAGTGHLTRVMRAKGFSVKAYEMLPRDKPEINDIITHDTTQLFDFDLCECLIIARPCHGTGWVQATLLQALDCGDAFYVGLKKNFEADLAGFTYEVVAKKVGKEGELLVRVYCLKRRANELRQIEVHGGHKEWWWYREAYDRYTTEPRGMTGFENQGQRVLKKVKRGNDLQVYQTKTEACIDKLNSGWIAPDGEWFGCYSRMHDKVAMQVVGCTVTRLETTGWIRCYGEQESGTMLWGFGLRNEKRRRPTPAQAKILRIKGYDIRTGGGLLSDKDFGV